ncbi:hypothetical protein LMORI2_18630 [Limnohabitans sp. MORI2]|uniref:DUF1993 domain-containing protein n=1 Tax=Limnohabitans sp. MORI2 TaxID=1751150 RepID=UPI00237739EF|nr:DUF1993 domain-containing protein [Limnohabitans sp. MORI2]BDU58881.1 hypothetical protein LMORI2_18630 [Limnohabitans sp. MORI2]
MLAQAIPDFIRTLTALSGILEKGAASAQARKIDPLVLTSARLAPDMFPLTKQVQIACDVGKLGFARLSGIEAPKFADTETTFEELQARIAKTIDYLRTVTAESLVGVEDKVVSFPAGPERVLKLKGRDFLYQWMTPNLYFHTTTAYAILRHNGVDVGKLDYLKGADLLP